MAEPLLSGKEQIICLRIAEKIAVKNVTGCRSAEGVNSASDIRSAAAALQRETRISRC